MDSNLTPWELVQKIQKKFNTVVIITLLFILLGVVVTLIMPKQYRGESQLVLVQKANPNIDSYTAQRSIDSSVELLINLAYTDVFFNSVVVENIDLKNIFPDNLKDRRRVFARNIIVRAKGSGFVSIETYNSSSETALAMNKVVINKLIEQAKFILGDTSNIQIVNQPALYDGVGRPNILVNLFGSAILGFVVGVVYVITRKDQSITYDFGIDDLTSPALIDDVEYAQNPILDIHNQSAITPDTEYDKDKF
jgi:capsular polysaccharide biosynthesis protein